MDTWLLTSPLRNIAGIVVVLLTLTGCTSVNQIANNAVANAAPAMTPQIELLDVLDIESGTPGLSAWSGDPTFYVPAAPVRFSMIIKRGQLNKMQIFTQSVPVTSNSTPVMPFDGNDPTNDTRWTYLQSDVSVSTTDKTMVTRYTFISPSTGPSAMADGTPIYFRFKEESINPRFSGSFSQFAEQTFIVMPVAAGSCEIPLFTIFSSPQTIDFAVRGCKEVVIDANGVEVFRQRAPGLRENIPSNYPMAAAVGFTSVGANVLRIAATDAVGRIVSDGKYKNTSAKPPCMTTTYVDNGDGKKVKFRIPC